MRFKSFNNIFNWKQKVCTRIKILTAVSISLTRRGTEEVISLCVCVCVCQYRGCKGCNPRSWLYGSDRWWSQVSHQASSGADRTTAASGCARSSLWRNTHTHTHTHTHTETQRVSVCDCSRLGFTLRAVLFISHRQNKMNRNAQIWLIISNITDACQRKKETDFADIKWTEIVMEAEFSL